MKIIAIKFEQPVFMGNYDKNFIRYDDKTLPGLKMFYDEEYVVVTCDALKGDFYRFHPSSLSWVRCQHEEKKSKKNND